MIKVNINNFKTEFSDIKQFIYVKLFVDIY